MRETDIDIGYFFVPTLKIVHLKTILTVQSLAKILISHTYICFQTLVRSPHNLHCLKISRHMNRDTKGKQ